MNKADKLFCDLEKFRSPTEMKEFVDFIYNSVHSDREYWEMAITKSGKFKKLLEEFYPLFLFSQSKFCNSESKLRIVLGNQEYDAIIKESDGTEYKFEITSYIDGKKEFKDGEILKEFGHTNPAIFDCLTLDQRSQYYFQQIVNNLKKKALRDYTKINMLIVVSTFHYFEIYNLESSSFIEKLIAEIKDLKIKCEKKFLLILNGIEKKDIDKNIYLLN